jgi:hypothetical protein
MACIPRQRSSINVGNHHSTRQRDAYICLRLKNTSGAGHFDHGQMRVLFQQGRPLVDGAHVCGTPTR